MSGEAASAELLVEVIQLLLATLQSYLGYGSFYCPTSPSIDTVLSTSFDYIIVGGGSAGSVLANRLSACSDANVLVLEAGGCPPWESFLVGLFTVLPSTAYEFNYTSTDDGYACQNNQDGKIALTNAKMLGGTSSLDHSIHVQGSEPEYDYWAYVANDSSWSFSGLDQYFKKSVNVIDPVLRKNSASFIGTSGPTKLERKVSCENKDVLNALEEMGYTTVDNCNTNFTNGVACEPLLEKADNVRQSGLVSYIHPVRHRSNLYILQKATVSKINIDSNNIATGVTFTYGNISYTVYASSKVILTAGAIVTPQLLMLSGIGPSDHLTDMGITVIVDSPVGDNLQDHTSASLIIGMDYVNSSSPSTNYNDFPVSLSTNYINLSNSTTQLTQFQSINLIFPQTSSGLLQLCMNCFKYKEGICQSMYEANYERRVLWLVNNILHPKSCGTVRLSSTFINDQPIVNLGHLSNESDLKNLAYFLQHMASIVNTNSFQNLEAEIIDLGLCSNETKYTYDFWLCYAQEMSSTMWHYCGTASLGSVLDSSLHVKGVSNLMVADASAMPYVPGGNIRSTVMAVAEKAADMIISASNFNCTVSSETC